MALLSDRDLKKLIEGKKLKIEPFDDAINISSIGLRLGPILIKYIDQVIKLGTIPESKEIDITNKGYMLPPGEFILGMTKEKIYIPEGYQGFIETKGNIARAGVQMHNCDGHIDPGFYGNITLEISNMHKNNIVQLFSDVYVCQLFIHELSSPSDSVYQGRYSNHTRPTIYLP